MIIQNVIPTVVGKDIKGRPVFMVKIKCDNCSTTRSSIRIEGDKLCYEYCQACGKRIYFRIANEEKKD